MGTNVHLAFLTWTAVILMVQVHAQTPGFAGKRVPITANVHTFPSLAQANRLVDIRLNYRLSLQGEYVLSRAHSLYAQLSRFQTNFSYERDNRNGEAAITSLGIEMGARLYSLNRRGNLAPMGFHQQLGLMFLPYQIEDLDTNFIPGQSDLGNFRDLMLTFAIGDQRIIHPSFIYFFNIQGGWLFNFFPNQATQEATLIKEFATSRLRNFSLLNVSAGIGFILF